jgi:hypothetical protein
MINRREVRIGLVLLAILIVAVILNGVIRETIAPAVLAWVWRVTLMSRGFPQVIVWAFFIALIPIIAVFSLIQTEAREELEPEMEGKHYNGRVHDWYRRLARMHEGDYFQDRLNRELAQLALETLAYEERLTGDEIKERLKNGQLPLSEEVSRFLKTGLRTGIRQQSGWSNGQAVGRSADIETILEFLEEELEVKRED